ncbi:hypothetical protein V1478_007560 [Vespula squamosa]|uniref:Uncharacterized protein n=1 Tax=Vespula squamosa TaxID=30214 RepID=A0ABD2B3H2_VESSQ
MNDIRYNDSITNNKIKKKRIDENLCLTRSTSANLIKSTAFNVLNDYEINRFVMLVHARFLSLRRSSKKIYYSKMNILTFHHKKDKSIYNRADTNEERVDGHFQLPREQKTRKVDSATCEDILLINYPKLTGVRRASTTIGP